MVHGSGVADCFERFLAGKLLVGYSANSVGLESSVGYFRGTDFLVGLDYYFLGGKYSSNAYYCAVFLGRGLCRLCRYYSAVGLSAGTGFGYYSREVCSILSCPLLAVLDLVAGGR